MGTGADHLPGGGVISRSTLSSADLLQVARAVVANVTNVLYGKDEAVWLGVCCLVAGGHLLIEDYPGVGKTTYAKALARSFGLQFKRVQFTADLVPTDVTGAMVYEQALGQLSFREGPVFTNILLADELNRASPRAQSSLLEAMEELQVSVDGASRALPRPFMVMATQNPFDASGTHPLPYNQRDRFLMRLSLGYPSRATEDALLSARHDRPNADDLEPVCSASALGEMSAALESIYVSRGIRSYVLDLVDETRRHGSIAVGASPRASLALVRASCALALLSGREFVVPDDVKVLAEPVLAHRLALAPQAEMEGASAGRLVREIVSRMPVPVDGS